MAAEAKEAERMTEKGPSLPIFDLAPLRKIEPELVVSRGKATPLESFMLALALFYNDWKTLAWVKAAILNPQKPMGAKVDAYTGQWVGMTIHISRLQLGALHEFIKLLQEEPDVVTGREITNLVALIPKHAREAWKAVVAVALEKRSDQGPLPKALERIRNALAFHYYQPKTLVKGFQNYFFDARPQPGNEAAMYSAGSDLEKTRFYYADAAANMAVRTQARAVGTEDVAKDASLFGNDVSLAVGLMIQKYLADRRTNLGKPR